MSDIFFNNTENNIIYNTSEIRILSESSKLDIYSNFLQFADVLEIAFKMWFIFIVVHLSIGLYIMYKDISGKWEKYKLIIEEKPVNKLHKYCLCIPYIVRDLFILLPIFLIIYVNYTSDFITNNLDYYNLIYCEFLIKFPLAYVIGNIWDMSVHRLWHQVPFLYKYVHKEHHFNLNEMCSLSAWRDSFWEFVLEIPGTFLIGPFIMRMNWLSHAVMISCMGFISSIDHSGFYVNFLIDSRYHFQHHNKPNSNFADLEFLDQFFGTKIQNLK